MSARRIIFVGAVPIAVKRAFNSLEPTDLGEVILWREAVARLCLDCVGETGISKPSYHNKLVREARNFVRLDPAFETMCDFAGLEPSALKRPLLSVKPFMHPEVP